MPEYTMKRIDKQVLPDAGYLLTAAEQRRLVGRDSLQGVAVYAEGACIGVLLFTVRGGTCQIERVEIVPAWRRCGAGGRLLRALLSLAGRQHWQVVVPFAASGQRDKVYRWLAAQPGLAIARQPGFVAQIHRDAIDKAATRIGRRTGDAVQPLFAQPKKSIAALCDRIEAGFPAVAAELRQGQSGFCEELSCCGKSGGQIKAVSLAAKDADGLSLRLLFAEPGCGALAMGALAGSMRQMLQKTDEEQVGLTVTGKSAEQLLDKLCPSYEVTQHLYTAYAIGENG